MINNDNHFSHFLMTLMGRSLDASFAAIDALCASFHHELLEMADFLLINEYAITAPYKRHSWSSNKRVWQAFDIEFVTDHIKSLTITLNQLAYNEIFFIVEFVCSNATDECCHPLRIEIHTRESTPHTYEIIKIAFDPVSIREGNDVHFKLLFASRT